LAAGSLRAHLLTLLLPPVALLLAVGTVAAYILSLEPASDAYDQALVDIGSRSANGFVFPEGRTASTCRARPSARCAPTSTTRSTIPCERPTAPRSPAIPSCRRSLRIARWRMGS
jgi:hypothetical protein